MELPIRLQLIDGEFVASALGDTGLRVARPTRWEAIDALRSLLNRQIAAGEITAISLPGNGLPASAGIYADDDTMAEMVAEIYRERDAEPKE